jgi:RNA polymerase sigma factor (sigma-70 family)
VEAVVSAAEWRACAASFRFPPSVGAPTPPEQEAIMDTNPITAQENRIIMAWARMCHPSVQDDVAQDIRVQWLIALPKHDPAKSSRKTYLNAIARYTVRAVWRHGGRKARSNHRTVSDQDVVIIAGDETMHLWATLPLNAHVRRLTLADGARTVDPEELCAEISALLASLPPQLRVVADAIMEGHTEREIAAITRTSKGTVGRRLQKIRRINGARRLVRPIVG